MLRKRIHGKSALVPKLEDSEDEEDKEEKARPSSPLPPPSLPHCFYKIRDTSESRVHRWLRDRWTCCRIVENYLTEHTVWLAWQ